MPANRARPALECEVCRSMEDRERLSTVVLVDVMEVNAVANPAMPRPYAAMNMITAKSWSTTLRSALNDASTVGEDERYRTKAGKSSATETAALALWIVEVSYTMVFEDDAGDVWPGDPDPDCCPELDVLDGPEDDVLEGVPMDVAHCVRYWRVTPCPSALTPVLSVPLPKPDHFWFEPVSVSL